MSRREDPNARGRPRERPWRPEPEVAPASGGHLAPDVHSPGPLFETAEAPRRSPRDRTEPLPGAEAQRRRAGGEKQRRRRLTVRRVKRTVRHVDPFSVLKLSLFLYAFGIIAWLIFVAIVYSLVDSTGIFDSIDELLTDLEITHPEITLGYVEKWALLIGVIFWLLMSLMNLLISFLYNVGADLFGGVELTFVERDDPRPAPDPASRP